MGIFRLYTGDDGESHMEELDLASHPELTPLQGARAWCSVRRLLGRLVTGIPPRGGSTSSPYRGQRKSACATARSIVWGLAT